jgi:uncharacterized protein
VYEVTAADWAVVVRFQARGCAAGRMRVGIRASPQRSELPVTAKFLITHQPGKRYHWNLLATNGHVIASSEHYETRRAAMEGVESVKKNAPTAAVEDRA